MLIEPKSATTTNNDSKKIVVSGQTETPEVTEKKKRGRKPTTNNYFADITYLSWDSLNQYTLAAPTKTFCTRL